MARIKEQVSSTATRRAVVQRHPMGCAVACVAFCLGKSYDEAMKHFRNKGNAWLNGYLCPEITKILNASGHMQYKWRKIKSTKNSAFLSPMSIVFCRPSKHYPHGHFLVKKGDRDFMNPWINFPEITPAKAGFQTDLPSPISYVIEPID